MNSSTGPGNLISTYDYQCNTGPCLMRARVVDGVVVNIEPNDELKERVSARPCIKAIGLVQKLYNPHRIKSPLKRTNPTKEKGVDPGWKEISWDEALNTVADKLKAVRAKGLTDENGYPRVAITTGADGIPRGTYGTLEAFIAAWGPVDRELSGGESVKCIHDEHLFGEYWHKAFMACADTPRCNWVLACGSNTNASGGAPVFMRHGEARIRGMKIVQVEPHLSVTGATATEWIPIKPKTDSALLFAMMHVILHELDWRQSCDTAFLKQMTNCPYLVAPDGYFTREPATGKPLVWDTAQNAARPYDSRDIKDLALEGPCVVNGVELKPAFQLLREHVKSFTPEWAAAITGIGAEIIRRLAHEFVDQAMIGAVIDVDGVKLPFRPVAIVLGKSVNNGVGGYQATWAQRVLQTLVGALEVPGGMLGQQLAINPTPIEVDNDGFIDYPIHPTDAGRWSWPPRSRNAWNVLDPLMASEPKGVAVFGPGHLSWLMLKNPPPGLPPISPPDIWFTYKTNPVISMWNTEAVIEQVKRIPFYVSFGYTLDETNEFADIILPDNMELEALHLYPVGGEKQWESFWEHQGFAIRQPVVSPLYNTRDITDICTDLAERAGILDKYNEAINQGNVLGIPLRTRSYDFSLAPSKKYGVAEIFDRLCRAVTTWLSDGKEEYDLEWFKSNGAFTIPFSRVDGFTKHGVYRRPWYLHHTMEQKKVRYCLPYQERVKRVGQELGERLHEKGIHWWDRQLGEYEPLPGWADFPAVFDTGPDYDLWVIACRSMQYSLGSNVSLPLMFEAAERVLGHTGAMINPRTAAARGIKDGDLVWLESPLGKIKARAVLRQGVHPEVIVTTQQFGHWTTPFARDLGWPNLNPLTPITFERTDKTGSSSDHVKVKLYKA